MTRYPRQASGAALPRFMAWPSPGTSATSSKTWLEATRRRRSERSRDAFGEKSFAVTILLLMFVPALPLPTGGITHVFEVIAVVIALQMVLGRRTIWLPQHWKQKELGEDDHGQGRAVRHPARAVVREVLAPAVRRPVQSALVPPRGRARDHRLHARCARSRRRSRASTRCRRSAWSRSASRSSSRTSIVLGIGMVIGTGGIVLIVTIGAAIAHFLKDRF